MIGLLKQFFDRIITSGDLTVTFSDGTVAKFGNGEGPPIQARILGHNIERQMVVDPGLKVGEAYMDGNIEFVQGDIYELLELVFKNTRDDLPHPSIWSRMFESVRAGITSILDWNTLNRSRSNVQHHYDLSGELYDLFLDPDRQYSCAYFNSPDDDLETAQLAKKRHIAAKLILDREDLSVLDIGSGWGGMGLHLARQFNAHVTGITLSDEQHAVSTQRAREDGFAGQVNFLLQDYRTLDAEFDRIVSVGMFEHVGKKHFDTYFEKCAKLLKKDGVMLLHTIGQSSPPSPTNPFIKKYIFPGGYIPALSEITDSVERSGLAITDVEILRLHYAETLKAWRMRFLEHWDTAKGLYDERFCRMWEFYLASCEAAFRWQDLVVFQIQLAHDPRVVPMTRDYMNARQQAPHRARKASKSAKKKRKASTS